MMMINSEDPNTFNRTLFGISDPTNSDSDQDGIDDGWEFCYAVYGTRPNDSKPLVYQSSQSV